MGEEGGERVRVVRGRRVCAVGGVVEGEVGAGDANQLGGDGREY